MTQSLFELEQKTDFIRRHIGPGEEEVRALLATVGAESLDDLIEQTVPAAIRRPGPLGIGAPMTEVEALAKLKGYAAKNQIAKSYIGMGYHGTHVPHGDPAQRAGKPGLVHRLHPYQPRSPRAVSKRC
jgi:glycine dehydrogenase